MQRETKIIVQYEYDDSDYRVLVRRTMQQHFVEQNRKQKKRINPFFWENVISEIVGALDNTAYVDGAPVIPPFLTGLSRRIHAAVFSFIAGVIPPMAMLGRSWL